MNGAQLSVEGNSLAFGGLQVLNNVSLSVGEAELLALIGPNGAGKTTVFNCISGFYRPTGEIRLNGASLLGRKPHEIAALEVARTFQHGDVPPQMTVVDAVLAGRHTRIRLNVFSEMLSLPVARRLDAAHRDAVLDILRLCDLETVAERPVGSLPFGTQKIIGTARALAAEPAILLLDESSAGLTQEEREAVARLIMRSKIRSGCRSCGSSTTCRWSPISPTGSMCSTAGPVGAEDRNGLSRIDDEGDIGDARDRPLVADWPPPP